MDIHQSSHTAEQLEFALKAIPSIGANNHWFIGDVDTGVLAEGLTPYVGENGNWWVGETDTGVYASGVKVTGAEVGQTIVVKAVDENGKPTEWEAADLPMGSLLEGCEVIAYGTLSEDGGISLSKDINGNPFSLTKAVLIAHGGFTGGHMDFGYNDFTNLKREFAVTCNVNASRFIGIFKKGAAIESMQTGSDFLFMRHQANYYLEKNGDQVVIPSLITENITKVQCIPWSGNGKFTANTNYILYGVRA